MVGINSLIKVGGSLMGQNKEFSNLVSSLEDISKEKNIVLTTGSKDISDIVRDRLGEILGNTLSERNHIDITWKSRDITSQAFCDLSDKFTPIFDVNEIESVLNVGNIPVIIQYELLKQLNPFPLVRGLSTDTSSAFFADLLNVDNFIKLTDVDGVLSDVNVRDSVIKEISTTDLKLMGKTCICKALADFLHKINSICFVMNGNDSDNLINFTRNGAGFYTKVVPK